MKYEKMMNMNKNFSIMLNFCNITRGGKEIEGNWEEISKSNNKFI